MSQFLTPSGLPARKAKAVLVSGEYPFLARELGCMGYTVLQTEADIRLPAPVQFHPDMQACVLCSEYMFVLKNSVLLKKFQKLSIPVFETEQTPSNEYPKDVLCNALILGDVLVGNPKTLDLAIRKMAKNRGFSMLAVRQGYTACACARVDKNSVITADQGIANVLEKNGFDVLRIRPGFIELPGYDTGFFGGCCGKLTPHVMAIVGPLNCHPDGSLIQNFLRAKKIEILELPSNVLLDVGGIVPIW